jgi:hypothetical protein
MTKFELSEAHQSRLEVRLRSLERLLKRVKAALADPPSDEWLTAYVEPLPEAIQGRLAALVVNAESELRQLIDDLNLQPVEVSISRMLLAHLMLGSNNVVEAMTPYLKSSGPVPGELAAYLDPQLERLDRALAEACRLIEDTLPNQKAPQKGQPATKPGKMVKSEAQP